MKKKEPRDTSRGNRTYDSEFPMERITYEEIMFRYIHNNKKKKKHVQHH